MCVEREGWKAIKNSWGKRNKVRAGWTEGALVGAHPDRGPCPQQGEKREWRGSIGVKEGDGTDSATMPNPVSRSLHRATSGRVDRHVSQGGDERGRSIPARRNTSSFFGARLQPLGTKGEGVWDVGGGKVCRGYLCR